MNKKIFKCFVGFVLVLFIVSTAWTANLEVHIIDVGQGDSTLIVSPFGKTVLVDTGTGTKATSAVLPYLASLGITDLDYIVATHYDMDHIGGIDEVVDGLGGISHIISAVYDRGGSSDKSFFDTYRNAVEQKRTTIVPEEVIDLGSGATLTCIAVGGQTKNGTVYSGDDENELSVVLILSYCDFQMYLGADIGEDMEPFTGPLTGDMDVYKVSHRGSKYSSTQVFLDAITPEVSTISVGNNSYGHPTIEVLNRLMSVGSYIYQTEPGNNTPPTGYGEVANGTFQIETDGCTYTVSGSDISTAARNTDGSHDCCLNRIVFSEVLYDSDAYGDTAGEWIELYNTTSSPVSISGWTITDNYSTYTIPAGTTINADSYLIIANDSSEFNGKYGCAPHISGLTLKLSNDGDYLILKESGGSVIDQVAWESGGSSVAGWGSSSLPKADEDKSIVRSNLNQDTDTYADWLSNQTPNPNCDGIPQIQLSRSQLYFGAACGVTTDSQTFLISNAGSGTLNWTVTDDANWLSYSPGSGMGSGGVTVSVNSTGLTAGVYTGSVFISDPSASNSPQTVSVSLTVYTADASPFGTFETPTHGSTVFSSVPFTGWVLDDVGVESVKIYRQQGNTLVYIGDALLVEGARPDIETAYPQYPMSYKAGWGYMMLTNFLPNQGNGTFTMVAKARDYCGHEITLGTKTITCDNANAVKPFGAIDTPTQGGEASGTSFRNQGWVLTPQPNKVPEDGSTILVYVDGLPLGHAAYNGYRSDIATLFPGYANSNGAHAWFDFDTTAYTNGVHTIAWLAADNAGNSDGIGSRFFSIQNSGTTNQQSWAIRFWPLVSNDPSRLIFDDSSPVGVIKGFNRNAEPFDIYPDDKGNITIEIKELERIEIHLADDLTEVDSDSSDNSEFYSGYHVVGDQFRPLPIGSTLDAERGIFYWQPGPGFFGQYEFGFFQNQSPYMIEKKIRIRIVSRF